MTEEMETVLAFFQLPDEGCDTTPDLPNGISMAALQMTSELYSEYRRLPKKHHLSISKLNYISGKTYFMVSAIRNLNHLYILSYQTECPSVFRGLFWKFSVRDIKNSQWYHDLWTPHLVVEN